MLRYVNAKIVKRTMELIPCTINTEDHPQELAQSAPLIGIVIAGDSCK